MKKTTDFNKLVSSAKDGNKKAFDKLYSLTCKEVWFSCVSLMKNKENAEDIFQETYLTAFEKIGTLEDNENFLCWIKKIAVNKCKDFLKTKVEYQLEDEYINDVEETDEVFIPEEYVTSNEKRKIIVQLMEETLTYVQYQTVFMYYFSNMTVADISEVMECSEGTVKSRLSFARAKMKTAIMNYEEENDDKLHAIIPVPFFEALFRAESENMEVPHTSIKIPTKNGTKVISYIQKTILATTKSRVIAGVCTLVFVCGVATSAVIGFSGCGCSNKGTATPDEATSAVETTTATEATTEPVETVPKNVSDVIKNNNLKVDKDGNVTDKDGNKLEVKEDGTVEVKDADGKKVTVKVDDVKDVVNNGGVVSKPTTPKATQPATKKPSTQKETKKETQKETKKPGSKPTENENRPSTNKPTSKPSGNENHPTTNRPTQNTTQPTTKKVEYKTIYHPAKTEEVYHPEVTREDPIYEEQERAICNACGADVTELIKRVNSGEKVPPEESHLMQHKLNGEKSSWHTEYKEVQVGTKTVVVEKAWTETRVIEKAWTETVPVD